MSGSTTSYRWEEAEKVGAIAFRAGEELTDCPYDHGSIEADGWLAGWTCEQQIVTTEIRMHERSEEGLPRKSTVLTRKMQAVYLIDGEPCLTIAEDEADAEPFCLVAKHVRFDEQTALTIGVAILQRYAAEARTSTEMDIAVDRMLDVLLDRIMFHTAPF